MPLTPDQRQQLQDALTAAFSEDELRRMLSLKMNVDLDRIVSHGELDKRAFDLIRWAERRGREAELLAAAHNYQSELNEKANVDSLPKPPAPDSQDGALDARAAAPQGVAVTKPDAAPQPDAPQPPKKRTVPPWVGVLAVAVLAGVILLFIEYGWFANDGGSPSTPEPANTVSATATLTAAPPSPTPPAPSAGVPTLDIAYGDAKQTVVDGISVLVSLPTGGDGSFWIDQIGTVRAVVVADGAQASGRLKIGECLLVGGVTVTVLDVESGANTFNRFAVARAGDGATCVNGGG